MAREAGVSPAAPYHHFKDKTELLEAVAHGGREEVSEIIANVRRSAREPSEAITDIGVAYVKFARENPALYRLMYDTTRDRSSMPEHAKQEDSGYAQVQSALIAAGCDPNDTGELELQGPSPLGGGARLGRDVQLQGIPAAEGSDGGGRGLPARHPAPFRHLQPAPEALSHRKPGRARWAPRGSRHLPPDTCTRATPSRR
ncbi:MAG: TetR/AcrR family transcriptional regulator [Caulobacteraceae bacterium]